METKIQSKKNNLPFYHVPGGCSAYMKNLIKCMTQVPPSPAKEYRHKECMVHTYNYCVDVAVSYKTTERSYLDNC